MPRLFRRILIGILVLASLSAAAVFGWRWYSEQRQERVLVLATGPREGAVYAFGRRLAQLVEARTPHLRIRVIETYGSRENTTLLADGTVQLAIVSGEVPLAPNMQVIDVLFPESLHLLARAGTGITDVAGLRGKTVGLLPEGSTSRALFWPILEHYGLTPDDVKTVTLLPHEAVSALRRETIDAYFLVIALDAAAANYIVQKSATTLIAIDQAAALRLRAPFLEKSEIPKGTYGGAPPIPPRDLPTIAVRVMLVGTDATQEGDAYSIVRLLHEARNEFIADNLPSVIMVDPAEPPLDQGLPMHTGSIDYYERDRPWFFVRYAEPIGVGLSIVVLLMSWFWAIKLKADRHSKNRADDYNARIIELAEKVEGATSIAELEVLRSQLFLVFRRVFSDLDEDRISPASIQGFTLAWYVAAQLLQERKTALLAADPPGSRRPAQFLSPPTEAA